MAPVNEGRAIFPLQEDPEKKNSTAEAGEALLVVLQASGEATCVYTDTKPGLTATYLRPGSPLWQTLPMTDKASILHSSFLLMVEPSPLYPTFLLMGSRTIMVAKLHSIIVYLPGSHRPSLA